MIYVDTREKKNEHIIRYFEKNGICYERKKLDVCDYTSGTGVWIERKQNLLELAGNITKENIARIREIGVDFVSSGALTHSAPILDISMKNLHAV